MRLRILAGLFLLASAAVAEARGGTLVIVGGGLDPANAEIFTALLDARPTEARGIAIIPAASSEPAASAQAFADAAVRYGAKQEEIVTVQLALVDDPATADVDESAWAANAADPAQIAAIKRAGAIWFLGGDQSRLTAVLLEKDGRDTPLLAAIRERLTAGAVIGGTSAGAAIMSEPMITQGDSLGALIGAEAGETLGLGRGFGFLPGALVDQHFGERARLGRLAVALTDPAQPQRIGLGIDEDTALLVSLAEKRARVVGSGYVTILDARAARRSQGRRIGIEDLTLGLAGPGDSIDIAGAVVSPVSSRKPTNGNEYVNRPLPAGGGMAYGDQSVAMVVGEGLVDNGRAISSERHSFAGDAGVTYRFAKTAATRGWWGRDAQGRARYTLAGVAFAITPIKIAIRKAHD